MSTLNNTLVFRKSSLIHRIGLAALFAVGALTVTQGINFLRTKSVPGCTQITTSINSHSPDQAECKKYLATLKAEEQDLYARIRKTARITPEQWDAHYKTTVQGCLENKDADNAEAIAQRHTLPAEFIALAHEALTKAGIDANAVTILPDVKNLGAANITDNVLFINVDIFKKFSLAAQRFILAHEVTHLKHGDSFHLTALRDLLKSDQHPLFVELCQLTEKRADTEGMLRCNDSCVGAHEFFTQWLEEYGDIKSNTHPLMSDRIAMTTEFNKTLVA
jgi:hypothetical protein